MAQITATQARNLMDKLRLGQIPEEDRPAVAKMIQDYQRSARVTPIPTPPRPEPVSATEQSRRDKVEGIRENLGDTAGFIAERASTAPERIRGGFVEAGKGLLNLVTEGAQAGAESLRLGSMVDEEQARTLPRFIGQKAAEAQVATDSMIRGLQPLHPNQAIGLREPTTREDVQSVPIAGIPFMDDLDFEQKLDELDRQVGGLLFEGALEGIFHVGLGRLTNPARSTPGELVRETTNPVRGLIDLDDASLDRKAGRDRTDRVLPSLVDDEPVPEIGPRAQTAADDVSTGTEFPILASQDPDPTKSAVKIEKGAGGKAPVRRATLRRQFDTMRQAGREWVDNIRVRRHIKTGRVSKVQTKSGAFARFLKFIDRTKDSVDDRMTGRYEEFNAAVDQVPVASMPVRVARSDVELGPSERLTSHRTGEGRVLGGEATNFDDVVELVDDSVQAPGGGPGVTPRTKESVPRLSAGNAVFPEGELAEITTGALRRRHQRVMKQLDADSDPNRPTNSRQWREARVAEVVQIHDEIGRRLPPNTEFRALQIDPDNPTQFLQEPTARLDSPDPTLGSPAGGTEIVPRRAGTPRAKREGPSGGTLVDTSEKPPARAGQHPGRHPGQATPHTRKGAFIETTNYANAKNKMNLTQAEFDRVEAAQAGKLTEPGPAPNSAQSVVTDLKTATGLRTKWIQEARNLRNAGDDIAAARAEVMIKALDDDIIEGMQWLRGNLPDDVTMPDLEPLFRQANELAKARHGLIDNQAIQTVLGAVDDTAAARAYLTDPKARADISEFLARYGDVPEALDTINEFKRAVAGEFFDDFMPERLDLPDAKGNFNIEAAERTLEELRSTRRGQKEASLFSDGEILVLEDMVARAKRLKTGAESIPSNAEATATGQMVYLISRAGGLQYAPSLAAMWLSKETNRRLAVLAMSDPVKLERTMSVLTRRQELIAQRAAALGVTVQALQKRMREQEEEQQQ